MNEIVWRDTLANFSHDTELTLTFWPWSREEQYSLEIDHTTKPGHDYKGPPTTLLAYPVDVAWLRTLYKSLARYMFDNECELYDDEFQKLLEDIEYRKD